MNEPTIDLLAAGPSFLPKFERLSVRVAQDLGRRVFEAANPGSELTEPEISASYGVSRTVAREAAQALAAARMLDVAHGRPMRARPAEDWDFMDSIVLHIHDGVERYRLLGELHEVRLLLEPTAAETAARSATPEHLAAMHDLVDRMTVLHHEPDSYLELDVEFHRTLASAGGNRVLRSILDNCRGLLTASREVSNTVPGSLLKATQAHRAIANAVAAGKPTVAFKAMERHIQDIKDVWLSPNGKA